MGLFPEVVLGPANEIFFRQRLAEIPALSVLHAVAMQPFELPFSFNAFCDHRQLKRFGHFDDVGSHVLILQRVHKGFINLQGIDIKILQIAQAGVTRTKIINVDGMPGAPKRSDGRGADGRIGKAALVNSRAIWRGWTPHLLSN